MSLGQREEFFFHDLVRHQHFVWRELVIERQRGAVLDALGDGILVEIPLIILTTESLERPLAIDRFCGDLPAAWAGVGISDVAMPAPRRLAQIA